MQKFHYYLCYKNHHYLLVDRFKNTIHFSIDFRTMYIFIREHKIQFNDIKLKSMLLSEFFRDYVTFKDSRGSNRL